MVSANWAEAKAGRCREVLAALHAASDAGSFNRTFGLRNEFENRNALRTGERFANGDQLAINVVLTPLLKI